MPNQTMVYSCSAPEQEYTMAWPGILLHLLISSLKIRFCEQSVFAKSPLFVFAILFLYLCVFLFLFVSFCILNLIKSHGLSSQTTLTFEGDFRLVFSNWTWCQYFTFVFPLAVYSVNIWRKSFVKMAEKIGKLMCFLSAYCRRQNWLGDGGVWDF